MYPCKCILFHSRSKFRHCDAQSGPWWLVLIKKFVRKHPLKPRYDGPFQVLLTNCHVSQSNREEYLDTRLPLQEGHDTTRWPRPIHAVMYILLLSLLYVLSLARLMVAQQVAITREDGITMFWHHSSSTLVAMFRFTYCDIVPERWRHDPDAGLAWQADC